MEEFAEGCPSKRPPLCQRSAGIEALEEAVESGLGCRLLWEPLGTAPPHQPPESASQQAQRTEDGVRGICPNLQDEPNGPPSWDLPSGPGHTLLLGAGWTVGANGRRVKDEWSRESKCYAACGRVRSGQGDGTLPGAANEAWRLQGQTPRPRPWAPHLADSGAVSLTAPFSEHNLLSQGCT